VRSTVTWLKAEASRRAAHAWKEAWSAMDRTQAWWGPALSKPPSTQLAGFHKDFEGPRELQCRIVQCLTGHCFVGEYYARFVPTEGVACKCGNPYESLQHVLFKCPAYIRARQAIYARFARPTRNALFSSNEGLDALADFLFRCRALRKRSQVLWPAADGNG
jgi:hypothetical protein